MKWKIWGRQHGKTHDILQWWQEAPEKRFILCGSALMAKNQRQLAWRAYDEHVRSGWWNVTRPQARKLIEEHILSVTQWKAECGPGRRADPAWEFAVDDAEVTITQLVGANVVIVAGQGIIDKPDPEVQARAMESYDYMSKKWPDMAEDLRTEYGVQ